MSIAGKIRVAAFITILVIISYVTVKTTLLLYCIGINEGLISVGEINDINIDGSDFTVLFKIIGHITNIFIVIIVFGVCGVVIGIKSLLLILPLRLIGLRNKPQLTMQEKNITKRCFLGVLSLSVITGLVLTGCTMIIPFTYYTLIWTIVVLFVYLSPVCKS